MCRDGAGAAGRIASDPRARRPGGESPAGTYDRISTIVCEERVVQQEVRPNLTPVGRPRVTVYELRVSRDENVTAGEGRFRVERTLQTVNGRPARNRERAECTDPKTGTPEPLEFLLAANQPGYEFTAAPAGDEPGTQALDFAETPPRRVRITWDDNCFNARGGGTQGRVWFDPDTFDVVRIDARLPRPFPVPVPPGLGGIRTQIRVERSDIRLRFTRVRFEDPEEVVMLPESIETTTVFRGAPSLHVIQTLGNFRRFLAETKIRPAGFDGR